MNAYFKGMAYLIRGAKNLFTKGLKRYVLLPLLFNFSLFAGVFYAVYRYMFAYSSEYINQLPAWFGFLNIIFFIIFLTSFFLLFLSVFTVLFNLIAAPFNGLLAEKAQAILYHSTIPSFSLWQITVRSIKRQGQFLSYYIPRFIGMCVLFFVPFIHVIYPLIWFFFNAWMLSVQYQDFVMDNNLINFSDMQKKLKMKKKLLFGFGSLLNLASFIPILNLLTMPAGVVGGVMIYCETHDPQRK